MPCPNCHFHHHCLCDAIPQLQSQHQFVLLQHPREQDKATNTGQLIEWALASTTSVTWSRVETPNRLIAQCQRDDISPWLLFPGDDNHPAVDEAQLAHQDKQHLFIIVDATWQEARKMVRRSPWLEAIPRLAINQAYPSRYRLRRNQAAGNLCTSEVASRLLATCGEVHQATQLDQLLDDFQTLYQAEQHHLTLPRFKT
ncbi:tRNA-uridine aminocarboxypropyltransferase [Thaumasiovibrio subtropicus]|uniref:tRNA-uridine aminocarboxypropyltransferase n=1 Tax=Thaumasiovibrio subtropicus TaxID=1891207 RepID=UPI000B34B13A|nr:DTW domain-containing protein [Thaumasiovibrio subtropicus]